MTRRGGKAWGDETLAIALQRQAAADWGRPTKRAELDVRELGFSGVEQELESFFRGPWYKELLTLLGCEELDLLEELRRRGL